MHAKYAEALTYKTVNYVCIVLKCTCLVRTLMRSLVQEVMKTNQNVLMNDSLKQKHSVISPKTVSTL